MEKKESSRRNGPKRPPHQKLFGANKIQINEDAATWLIGSIVEKGILDEPQSKPFVAPSAPKPTVLPFPVARHRSHGPHWAPVGKKMQANGNDNVDGEDGGENFSGVDPIAAFANPVQRKQKKGLNLTQWRDLDPNDKSSVTNRKEENKLLLTASEERKKHGEAVEFKSTPIEMNVEPHFSSYVSQTKTGEGMRSVSSADFSGSVADMELDDLDKLALPGEVKNASSSNFKVGRISMSKNSQIGSERASRDDIVKVVTEKMEKMDPAFLDMVKQKHRTSISATVSSSGVDNFGNEQGSMTLESQIDAENRAQLQRMSPEEIEQAQAEIMQKMDPALLKVLKKRGEDKLKKQKCSSSDKSTNGEAGNTQKENPFVQDAKDSSVFESDISHTVTNATSKDTQRGLDNDDVQKMGSVDSSSWNAWSERVETVRGLRFSLDGTIVPVPENGEISVQSTYTANNVAERDFLRTEGDPGAAGYTIKEALALTRSVVPGQRALALHLLASVLDKALHDMHQNKVGRAISKANTIDRSIDWEAVWAFALGPEPELVLSLRMSLDDNHNSVVVAGAKVIQCTLSCDVNENFFDLSEKIATSEKDIYTAPIFRSRPEIDDGFLHGGFWKYNAKPSNILPFDEDIVAEKTEGERTIQDDIVVAGQDIATGLVRMGILSRIRYLLEAEPTATLEESMISILIAIARHSPTCASAIIKCERLVQTVVNRFTMKDTMEIHLSKIKSVTLLKVLARSDKKNCIEFIKNGIFHSMTWHLYRHAFSIDHWVKLGKDHCKLASALMVEQLRFWKVCIQYGYCLSYFADIFPSLCLWLNPPTFEKLIENNVLNEFASITMEAYLVLAALARRLPNFYSEKHPNNEVPKFASDGTEIWCWSHVGPMVDLALKWVAVKSNPYMHKFFQWKEETSNLSVCPLLWVISSVVHMLSSVLERVTPDDTISLPGSGGVVPWLPEFVPKIGLEIIKNGFLCFSGVNGSKYGTDPTGEGSFIEELCYLRHQSEYETSLTSVCCLHGLVQVVVSIDTLIQPAKTDCYTSSSRGYDFLREGKILEDGILKSSLTELRGVLIAFMKLVTSEWHYVQSIEIFGRGGPAPGIGLGWGASGGGFWSSNFLLAQTDVGLLTHLLEIFQIVPAENPPPVEEMTFTMQRMNSALGVCLTVGPRDRVIVEKVLDILLQVPSLKYLDFCIRHFLDINERSKLFKWEYKEEDYLLYSKILASHFKNRWLSVKKKSKEMGGSSSSHTKSKKGSAFLETIPEDLDTSSMTSQHHCCTSLVVEWAHQKLPLPMHWFLSPISTIYDSKHSDSSSASTGPKLVQNPTDFLEVAEGGLFFLLGIEAMSSFLPTDVHSPVQSVPLIWKLHSLSVILLVGMGVLEEEKSRDVYKALQELYGQLLDKSKFSKSAKLILEKDENLLPVTGKEYSLESLRFQSDIHESYTTFIETFVEQFAAISYGDLIFGRQVAIYLHCYVESAVRLAAWNALSNTRVLELLPPLEQCFADAEGYLEPVEDDERILEAYVKSWVSGALDRAATRGSITYTLALHHLSSFIFHSYNSDKLLLRNKLAKSLLRDSSRRQQHEGMMLDLIRYNKPSASQNHPEESEGSLQTSKIEKRFEVLIEACEGNSSLLTEVKKLKSFFGREQYVST